MAATTPASIDPVVETFLKEVPGTEHAYVPVIPERWAEPNHCDMNCLAKVKKDGGSIVQGWIVWYEPGVLIESEWHCVWKDQSGKLIDVTPKPDKEERILFVTNENAVKIGDEPTPDNIRKAFNAEGDRLKENAERYQAEVRAGFFASQTIQKIKEEEILNAALGIQKSKPTTDSDYWKRHRQKFSKR